MLTPVCLSHKFPLKTDAPKRRSRGALWECYTQSIPENTGYNMRKESVSAANISNIQIPNIQITFYSENFSESYRYWLRVS